MALVDKHKVKRQRLDRICEGETPFFHSVQVVYTQAHKFEIRFIWLLIRLYFIFIYNKPIIL